MIQTNRFRKCIWIINALRTHKALTLDEMNEKWMRDAVDCGKPLSRTSFNRNRDYISDSYLLGTTYQDGKLEAIETNLGNALKRIEGLEKGLEDEISRLDLSVCADLFLKC